MNKYTRVLCFCSATFLMACSDKQSIEEHPSDPENYVRIISPARDSVVNGVVDTRLEIRLADSAVAARFGLEEEELFDLESLATRFQVDTGRFEDGPHTLRVEIDGESGQTWSDSLPLVFDNPDFSLVQVAPNQRSYVSGDEVVLALEYTEPGLILDADFLGLDSNYSTGSVTSSELGDGAYELKYRISEGNTVAPEEHEIRIFAANAGGEHLTSVVRLRLDGKPTMEIVVEGASFIDGPPPAYVDAKTAGSFFGASLSGPLSAASKSADVGARVAKSNALRSTGSTHAAPDAEDSAIRSVTGPETLLSGDQGELQITWETPESQPATRLVISESGEWGYYLLPVEGSETEATLRFSPDRADGTTRQENLVLTLVDSNNAVLGTATQPVNTVALEDNAVSVSVTWDTLADLDLSVTEPDGSAIDFVHRTSSSEGRLELDANSMCEESAVSAERISWPLGSELGGSYAAVVSIYDPCGANTTSYEVTVRACGTQQTFRGSFAAGDVQSNSTREIPSFTIDCPPGAFGRVQFQKGVLARTLTPAAFVPVRAVAGEGSNRTVLASDVTDLKGRYQFDFPTEPGDYRFEVETTWTAPREAEPRVSVVELDTARTHVFAHSQNELGVAPGGQREVLITVEEGSGALNILDAIRKGMQWVQSNSSKLPPPLPVRWTKGMNHSGSQSNFYFESSVWIAGARSNPAEFDDSTINHEFFHHVLKTLSLDQTPGGTHFWNFSSAPTMAWSEGAAWGLAQHSLQTSVALDAMSDGRVYVIADVESNVGVSGMMGPWTGTSDGTMKGSVNEFLVAMILWDLLDPANEPHDTVANTDASVAQSMFSFLPQPQRPNRGATGVDLVDFLDGWRVAEGETPQSDADLCGILKDRSFPYEFPNGRRCP